MKKYLFSTLLMIPVLLPFVNSRSVSGKHGTEFLLIGVMHHIPDSLSCNWEVVYQKLLKYKADQIAVEEVMPGDTSSLIQNYGKNYRSYQDSLALAWEGTKINAADSIRRYRDMLSGKENPVHRLKLWKYLHLGMDMGNLSFQTYRIAQNIGLYKSLIDSTTGWGRLLLKRCRSLRKTSEFYNLIYPLALQSGIDYLYPTDERITFPAQSEAYEKFAGELEGTIAMKELNDFWKSYQLTEADHLRKCNGLLLINSKAWVDKTDYGQARILEYTQNSHYRQYAGVWYKRNKSIADRIIQSAKRSDARKMVVFYGNMHIYPVRKYLEEQGYKVKLLEDI